MGSLVNWASKLSSPNSPEMLGLKGGTTCFCSSWNNRTGIRWGNNCLYVFMEIKNTWALSEYLNLRLILTCNEYSNNCSVHNKTINLQELKKNIHHFIHFLKQKCEKFSGYSFSNVVICYFSLSYIIVTEISFHFGLFGQNKQSLWVLGKLHITLTLILDNF